MKTRIAFYHGRKGKNPAARIGDRLICLVTGKPFSHCELVERSTHAAGMTYAGLLSSSLRDGGVRWVWRLLTPGRWVVVEFDGDSKSAITYIKGRIGTPYGWLDLLSFLLPFRVSWSGSDFCSEVVSAALGLDKPWHKSPGDLYEWAVQQPGARVVPEDELRQAWSA
jgi:hypothetical protein